MKRWIKVTLIIVGFLLIGPFLIPVRPAQGIPPGELGDADSRFVQVNAIDLHYKEYGEGEQALILLHGFGASLFSWRDVMEPLAAEHTVIAFDRPAFGLTQRPMQWEGETPYSQKAQVELTIALLDELGLESAVLIGHSAGGAVAVQTALEHPDRVDALVLVAPALEGRNQGLTQLLLNIPQVRRLGPLFVRVAATRGVDVVRMAWHDKDTLNDEVLDGYTKPLQAENWDRALWEFARAAGSENLQSRLEELTMPVQIITGDADKIVHPQASIAAAQVLGVEPVIFQYCGHLPHEEYPDIFIQTVTDFLRDIWGRG